jgi:type VI protein secretion system component VasF
MIRCTRIFNRNWVDTRWQQYSLHLHTNNTQNTGKGTYITIKKLSTHNNKKLTNLLSAGRAPSLRVIPWHLPYN